MGRGINGPRYPSSGNRSNTRGKIQGVQIHPPFSPSPSSALQSKTLGTTESTTNQDWRKNATGMNSKPESSILVPRIPKVTSLPPILLKRKKADQVGDAMPKVGNHPYSWFGASSATAHSNACQLRDSEKTVSSLKFHSSPKICSSSS